MDISPKTNNSVDIIFLTFQTLGEEKVLVSDRSWVQMSLHRKELKFGGLQPNQSGDGNLV
jgi:hypothetical protein